MDKIKSQKVKRKTIQALTGIIQNANFKGFLSGKIYSGPLKKFCVPGMNCYSCPGALGACPIGSMQAVLNSRNAKFPFYVVGYLSLIGVFVGRFICGWLCLFGLIQELLFKIPTKKVTVSQKVDKVLRYFKYVFLFGFVILMPTILRTELGISFPYFCKWVCPIGILEGGLPLMAVDKAIRAAAHYVFAWKLFILIAIILMSIFINRPFCKYICPLGAFYGLFHKISFLRLDLKKDACINCGACSRTCNMQVDPSKTPDSAECIRCGECIKTCPTDALSFVFIKKAEQNKGLKRNGIS